jgi:hypothetical protein
MSTVGAFESWQHLNWKQKKHKRHLMHALTLRAEAEEKYNFIALTL